jgi:hypothetical protein
MTAYGGRIPPDLITLIMYLKIKGKVSLRLIKHHAMKTYVGVEI